MNKTNRWARFAVLLLVLSLTAIAGQDAFAEEPVPALRWKFEPGQVYRFDITQSSSTEIDVAGNKTLQPESRRVQIRWEVLAATPEVIEVEMRYTEIEMELGTTAGKVAASTRSDFLQTGTGKAGNLLRLLLQRMQPLVDQPIKLQVEPSGKVRQVELPAELSAHITKEAETRPLREAVSETGIQELLGSFLTPFPSEPVADWQHKSTYEVSAGVPLTRNTKYKLGPWSESEANVEITYSSELSFPEQYLIGPDQPNDPNASQAKDPNPPSEATSPFDFDTVSVKWPRIALQDCNGRLVFDVKEGYVREATGRTTLTTEKSYSDTKIKTTISTQMEVKIQRG